MRYYKLIKNDHLIAIGTGYGGTEITEAEYNDLLTMIRTKADLVNKLYANEIAIDEVPAEWQEEIQRRAEERIAAEGDVEEAEATEEDYLSALSELGVSVNEEI